MENENMTLSAGQKKQLKTMAHHLKPNILIGRQGLTEMVKKAINEELDFHELIKIRFNDFKDEKRELTDELVRETGACLVGMVGNVATIYRESRDEAKRVITLK